MKKEKKVCECCDTTEKLDASEYARLCRVDARMDALISYINFFDHAIKTGSYPRRPISEGAIKAIIGMCDE